MTRKAWSSAKGFKQGEKFSHSVLSLIQGVSVGCRVSVAGRVGVIVSSSVGVVVEEGVGVPVGDGVIVMVVVFDGDGDGVGVSVGLG
jgi:hypothetical protein